LASLAAITNIFDHSMEDSSSVQLVGSKHQEEEEEEEEEQRQENDPINIPRYKKYVRAAEKISKVRQEPPSTFTTKDLEKLSIDSSALQLYIPPPQAIEKETTKTSVAKKRKRVMVKASETTQTRKRRVGISVDVNQPLANPILDENSLGMEQKVLLLDHMEKEKTTNVEMTYQTTPSRFEKYIVQMKVLYRQFSVHKPSFGSSIPETSTFSGFAPRQEEEEEEPLFLSHAPDQEVSECMNWNTTGEFDPCKLQTNSYGMIVFDNDLMMKSASLDNDLMTERTSLDNAFEL